MDLVRVILLKIEEEHAGVGLANLEVEGYDRATIAYRCQLLEEAGLVSSCIVRYADDSVFFFSVGGLTWEGADYLDKVRDDSVWAKTKNLAAEKGVRSLSKPLRRYRLQWFRLWPRASPLRCLKGR